MCMFVAGAGAITDCHGLTIPPVLLVPSSLSPHLDSAFGTTGDMVLFLRDGAKLEMRCVQKGTERHGDGL